MADDALKVLERLSRKIGREAARSARIAKASAARGEVVTAERFLGEMNLLRWVQSFIRDEMRKAKKGTP